MINRIKIKVCVYIIYVCVLCIVYYKDTYTQHIFLKYLHVF